MEECKVYLKPNVVFEPLINHWYAWSHLISPATAAMNIVGRHLPIMESYISDPDMHAKAVLNPKWRGGPFMDLGGEKVDQVVALRDQTIQNRQMEIALAEAIKDLDQLLIDNATGFGLEDLYALVPEVLKGYVELYYDRNNNAGFRFFETLLYRSEFFNKSSQSVVFWLTNNDERPFCLSTPRLDGPNILHLPIPFDHPFIDELARMRRMPQTLSFIANLAQIPDERRQLFETFFTTEKPRPYGRYTGDKIRMRYFGHACILIETRDVSILVDPLISYYGYPSDVYHFSDLDLPDTIDYVLITHNHQDHILLETLLQLRHRIKHVVVPATNSGKLEDPNLKLMFHQIGFQDVLSLDDFNKVMFDDARIMAIPFTGEHSDLNILTKLCYLVQVGTFKLLFFADSRVIEPRLYEYISKEIGPIDVLFLGMECDGAPLTWLYGPLMTKRISRDQDNSRRLSGCDCEKGMALVNIFKPKEVYVYAMGAEPWVQFISSVKYTDESNPIIQSNKLVKMCNDNGIIAERLYGEKELLYERVPNISASSLSV